MPEGDTVYRSARALNEVLASRVLDRCDIRVPAYATIDLTGERVESVISVGKHLLHRVGEFTIHSHLKMEGSWHIYHGTTAWRRPAWQARAILGVAPEATPPVTTVGFALGELEVVPREREDELVGYLGPYILGPRWDADLALANLTRDPDRAVGLALLDQRVIAGLGNVYRNELLFLRGLLPERPVGQVRDPAGLIALAHRLITANRDRVERTTTGDLRRGRMTYVNRREGQPCRRCGTPIQLGAFGENELTERQTYFCPVCQT